MNEAQLNDLKQFITATVSQAEARLEVKIADLSCGLAEVRGELAELRADFVKLRGELDDVRGELTELRGEMTDGFIGVGEAIEIIHDQSSDYNHKTNKRLTRLERLIA